MKSCYIFASCLVFLFTNSLFSQVNTTDSLNKFKLEIGAGLGIAAGSFNYLSIGGTNSSVTSGTSRDLLNEFTIYGLARFSKQIGVGLEAGRLTHFEVVGGVKTYSSSGFPTSESIVEYISGLYFAPFVRIGQVSIGITYMTPSEGTFFLRAGNNVSTDLNYEDLDSTSQSTLKSILQSYINVYGRYDHDVTNITGFPSTVYAKLAFNLQHPIDYGKNNELKTHFRAHLTIGASLNFTILK